MPIDLKKFEADLNSIQTQEGMSFEDIKVASKIMSTLLKDALLQKNIQPEEKGQLIAKYLEVWRNKQVLKYDKKVVMTEINMRDAELGYNDLSYANLQKSNLTRAKMNAVDLTAANLAGANLAGANLTGAILEGVDLTGADLTEADLTGVNLANANLTNTNLTGAILAGANLKGTNLSGANLTGANLRKAYLPGVNLEKFNLEGVNLEGANLRKTNLTGANLKWANLKGADLTKANLTGAYLEGAYLEGSHMKKTILKNANFTDSILLPSSSSEDMDLTLEQRATAIDSTQKLVGVIDTVLKLKDHEITKNTRQGLPNLYKAARAKSDDCPAIAKTLYNRFPFILNPRKLQAEAKSLIKGEGKISEIHTFLQAKEVHPIVMTKVSIFLIGNGENMGLSERIASNLVGQVQRKELFSAREAIKAENLATSAERSILDSIKTEKAAGKVKGV